MSIARDYVSQERTLERDLVAELRQPTVPVLFSELARITDAAGRAVKLSHTHRFRHTKLTRLAELGLPVHVLQRYAGHSTPTMSMHCVARRDEHAEQAFLATRKFKADGTRVAFSQEDHDALHLLER